jgi:hypothetical protein
MQIVAATAGDDPGKARCFDFPGRISIYGLERTEAAELLEDVEDLLNGRLSREEALALFKRVSDRSDSASFAIGGVGHASFNKSGDAAMLAKFAIDPGGKILDKEHLPPFLRPPPSRAELEELGNLRQRRRKERRLKLPQQYKREAEARRAGDSRR